MLSSQTLRPGYLVSLKTIVTGNVQYSKQVIESEHITGDGAQKARWETERTVFDPIEHELAAKARNKARTVITAVCASSAFGLLCPADRADKLEEAIKEARKVAQEFNEQASLSRLSVYVITGKVAENDAEAVRAINSEVRDLMASMEAGVKNLDVKIIRDAANKARNLGTMLTDSAKEKIQVAIDAARGVARQIVKAGEAVTVEVDRTVLRQIASQRTMFLDLDDASEILAPKAEARAIEMEMESTTPPPVAKVARIPRLELD